MWRRCYCFHCVINHKFPNQIMLEKYPTAEIKREILWSRSSNKPLPTKRSEPHVSDGKAEATQWTLSADWETQEGPFCALSATRLRLPLTLNRRVQGLHRTMLPSDMDALSGTFHKALSRPLADLKEHIDLWYGTLPFFASHLHFPVHLSIHSDLKTFLQ